MQRIIFCLLSGVFYSSLSFGACPNLTGSYQLGENTFVGYEQTDCKFLKRYFGSLVADGSVSYHFDRQFKNEKPYCSKYNQCETVVFSEDTIIFELNFNSGVMTDEHGHCSHNGYTLSNDKDGNLIGKFKVFSCEDKFQGEITKVYLK